MEYPEHEKLKKISDQSQVIGEFLEHLEKKGVVLCVQSFRYVPIGKSKQIILAEYFGIDLDKLEVEKQEMIEGIRSNNIS